MDAPNCVSDILTLIISKLTIYKSPMTVIQLKNLIKEKDDRKLTKEQIETAIEKGIKENKLIIVKQGRYTKYTVKNSDNTKKKLPSKKVEREESTQPKKNLEKEYYVLQLSVSPGGARKFDLYLLDTLKAVFEVLQKDLVKDAVLAIWYGEEILLYRCRGDKSIEVIDLHQYITFYVGDFPPIKFDKNNKVIGYTFKDDIFNEEVKSNDDDSPIDFTLKDINEVHRYLNYDMYEIFRIMNKRGVNGSNMERYPPNVGVQIDLSSIPRIEEPIRFISELKEIEVDLDGETYTLNYGVNELE